ncbi:hypothetical protein B0H13DRAFT_1863032 [Mycena leptocephala]|nr:hypothetical protein B0H13DRAFT_1863032 [Mycena leptocephala]
MYTLYWIDHLLSRFKEMKNDEPDWSNKDIQTEWIQWTVDNRAKIYSAFLTTDGTNWLFYLGFGAEIAFQASIKPKTHRWKFCTPSSRSRQIYLAYFAHAMVSRNKEDIFPSASINCNRWTFDPCIMDDAMRWVSSTFMAWKAAGELAALLWVPEIWNLNAYRRDLKVAVANVLNIFSLIDLSKIITKIKLHLLAHIDDDAAEFCPLVGVAADIFESFNAISRYWSILPNHLAPSCDIALQLGDQEGLKHRLTGEAKLESLKRGQKNRPVDSLESTTAVNAVNYGMHAAESTWNRCSSVSSTDAVSTPPKCPNVAATWLAQPAGSFFIGKDMFNIGKPENASLRPQTGLVTRCGFCSYFLGSVLLRYLVGTGAVPMYEQFVRGGDPDVEQLPTQLEARQTGSTLAPFTTTPRISEILPDNAAVAVVVLEVF